MTINTMLIKARETGSIMNKTADIYKLLLQKKEERQTMTTKPYSNTLEMQRILAGKTTAIKATHEQAEAIHQLFEKNARVFYNLPTTLARYAATGAPVTLFQKPKAGMEQSPEITPTKPGFKK